MHRLIADQPLQQRSRAVPVDPLQFEEADIEPVGEQAAQIRLERHEQRLGGHRLEHGGAQIDQELHPVGDGGELGQQPHPRRFECRPQPRLGERALGGIGRFLHAGIGGGHRLGVAVEAGEGARKSIRPAASRVR